MYRLQPLTFQSSLCKMDLQPVERLPNEMLVKVFEFLRPRDRKSAIQVNSMWRAAGEASHLWDWVRLPRVVGQDSRERVIEMLRSDRLARVKFMLAVHANAVSNNLLEAMIQHAGIKELFLLDAGLQTGLDPQLLIKAITRMEGLVIGPLPTHLS